MLDQSQLSIIKSILQNNGLRANKSMGQNFLVTEQPLITLIKAADITDKDTIVEIGPGLGTLTQELAKNAKLVLAIEKDRGFVEYLRKKFKSQSAKIKIVCDDILTYNLQLIPASTPASTSASLGGRSNRGENYDYKVVANLPYNITSPVIRKFLEADKKPSEIVLMVQKEVAERICAKPGDSNRGVLTVMVEFYASAEIVAQVSKENFWPQPKVDSAIIKLKINPPRVDSPRSVGAGKRQPASTAKRGERVEAGSEKLKVDSKIFFRIIKAGFSQKRRQIHNSLAAILHLSRPDILDILNKAKIKPELRAEDLQLTDWFNLYRTIQNVSKKRAIGTTH